MAAKVEIINDGHTTNLSAYELHQFCPISFVHIMTESNEYLFHGEAHYYYYILVPKVR